MADFVYPAGAKAAGSPDISQDLTNEEAQEMIRSAIPFAFNADIPGATELLNRITWETASILWPSIGRIDMGPDGIDVSVIHTGNN